MLSAVTASQPSLGSWVEHSVEFSSDSRRSVQQKSLVEAVANRGLSPWVPLYSLLLQSSVLTVLTVVTAGSALSLYSCFESFLRFEWIAKREESFVRRAKITSDSATGETRLTRLTPETARPERESKSVRRSHPANDRQVCHQTHQTHCTPVSQRSESAATQAKVVLTFSQIRADIPNIANNSSLDSCDSYDSCYGFSSISRSLPSFEL